MLSCKEIVQLMSSSQKMPVLKRAEIKLHLMMCQHCSRYSKQLQMMSQGLKRLLSKKTKTDHHEVNHLESEVLEQWKKRHSK